MAWVSNKEKAEEFKAELKDLLRKYDVRITGTDMAGLLITSEDYSICLHGENIGGTFDDLS